MNVFEFTLKYVMLLLITYKKRLRNFYIFVVSPLNFVNLKPHLNIDITIMCEHPTF